MVPQTLITLSFSLSNNFLVTDIKKKMNFETGRRDGNGEADAKDATVAQRRRSFATRAEPLQWG